EGTCSMLAGDPEITLETAGGFSILQGTAGSMKTVSCDASAEGVFNRTLSCTHNGTSPASPVEYAVTCTVPPAGSAVFDSDPLPGAAIDVDGGADVVVGDTDPTSLLTLYNEADPGDQNLDIDCTLAGAAAITVAPDISGGILISPDGNQEVTFTCDTAASGTFAATYTCNYGNGGLDNPAGLGQQTIYDLSCDVREPEAHVEITPAPATPQTKSVPPGGSTSFSFDFTEVNDEGLDGNLVSCSVGGGQGFTVTSPTFPTDILSGSTVTVVVGFTDPTGADSWSDTLTCMFGDSDDDDTEVSWLLTVNIGGDARFTVLKDFTDGNPGEVTVVLDCNTGLILDQDKDITEDGIGVTFVVTDYTAGNLACSVKELPVAGYSADYEASGDSASSDADDPSEDAGCYWTEIAGGVDNLCEITNTPDPVDVVINKEWLYPGSSGATDVSNEFEILLVCENAEIVDGDEYCGYAELNGAELTGSLVKGGSCKLLQGSGDETFTEQVIPYDWPGGECYAVEVDVDPAVEVENGCSAPMTISAGSGDSCTITNTVFYEGIPTLSEYGMALLALLMLGMGFVAVRRIA
ncbi:MAG TPA: IPTL-CTERM sorting domain-containing protein, partial [Xanthomonadales bacterium]|nr:IPTL-CTERM sorting domain-containing protein [Xanthomonadales bacterium]